MNHHLKLRQVTKEDLPQVVNLFSENIRSICQKDYSPEQINIWASASDELQKWHNRIETQYFICATIELKIVGFASLESDGYLDLMYVHKDHQRLGIGQSLLEKLIDKARELCLLKIHTEASITAMPFFEKQGFQFIEENSKIFKGVEFINYKMKKIIS